MNNKTLKLLIEFVITSYYQRKDGKVSRNCPDIGYLSSRILYMSKRDISYDDFVKFVEERCPRFEKEEIEHRN